MMPLALRHHLGGAAQPLLGLDHAPRGEPVLAAPILAERDQVGRGSHRTQNRIILFVSIARSEEHTSELQSLMRISYAVFCLKKQKKQKKEYRNKRRPQQ